jgi:hypothetical protein
MFRKIKVGYYPLSKDLTHPGDRRRLKFWADNRGVNLHIDPDSKMDLIFVSEKSDFFSIAKSHSNTPLIYDLIDGYLETRSKTSDTLRASAKFLTGEISKFSLRYTRYVARECEIATKVVCSTAEQSLRIKEFNSDVSIILDSHEEFPFVKPELSGTKDCHLLWEGMPYTLKAIGELKLAFEELEELQMDVISDKEYFRLLGRYFPMHTEKLIKECLNGYEAKISLVSWTQENLVKSALDASIAVLPIDLQDPIQVYKAENRLLIMWRLGLPCLVSPTLAYSRVMNSIGEDMICKSPADWLSKISQLRDSESLRYRVVEKGQEYLRNFIHLKYS